MFVFSEEQNPVKSDGAYHLTQNLRDAVLTMNKDIKHSPTETPYIKRVARNIASVYEIGQELSLDEFFSIRFVLVRIATALSGEDIGGQFGTYIRHPHSSMFTHRVGNIETLERDTIRIRAEGGKEFRSLKWIEGHYINLEQVVGSYEDLLVY